MCGYTHEFQILMRNYWMNVSLVEILLSSIVKSVNALGAKLAMSSGTSTLKGGIIKQK